MYLCALGADVIKIESVQRPDGFRFSGAVLQEGDDYYDRSGIWQATNLNKRDLTVDLTRADGRRLLERLVGSADVVIENFSARVVEQFGLRSERLRELKPDAIMVGFRRPGDRHARRRRDPGRARAPASHGRGSDDRGRSARGRRQPHPWSSSSTGVSTSGSRAAPAIATRASPRRGVYPCAPTADVARPGDWVAIAVRHDRDWSALVEALGSPDWAQAPRSQHSRGVEPTTT
jgi:crotonobetainyl-CoA:carnitine CoA-transferase CaiB-like acyl-CoA transferase